MSGQIEVVHNQCKITPEENVYTFAKSQKLQDEFDPVCSIIRGGGEGSVTLTLLSGTNAENYICKSVIKLRHFIC